MKKALKKFNNFTQKISFYTDITTHKNKVSSNFYFLFCSFLLFINCSGDLIKANNKYNSTNDNIYLTIYGILNENKTIMNDVNSPIVGSDGKISINNISSSSIDISWTNAEDDQTPTEELEYNIFISESELKSDFSNSPPEAQIKNQNNFIIRNLKNSTTYYLYLTVQDNKKNQSKYLQETFKTSDGKIYLYSGSQSNGNLGGRQGIDQLCKTIYSIKYKTKYQCNNIHGFTSTTEDDEIRDFPKKYSLPIDQTVFGISALNDSLTIISDSFNNLLTQDFNNQPINLKNSLDSANVFSSTMTDYWTGTSATGEIFSPPLNCQNFTSSSVDIFGETGYSNEIDSSWMQNTEINCSSSLIYYLCICF